MVIANEQIRDIEATPSLIVDLPTVDGELDTTRCAQKPRVGERVTVIPNHICPCVNLQDAMWLSLENGSWEKIRIDARGRLS